MCGATTPNKTKIGGCLSLLQSWVPLSAMLLSRCTRRIECCDNLDYDNRFSWHLRCSMMSTKLTYGNRIQIGRFYGRNISKFRKIGMIIYLLAN
ncbi:hypothetical protein Goshw_024847 [Gossypium schwendimanii]|uniref:Uncharacterized protein n=1 Tax=Gossypium schwendimanii TaxID=34291 RepID=A0A7J9MVL1_GOSSC|nr:hypothetical protein [Gossypium schwendimanii]